MSKKCKFAILIAAVILLTLVLSGCGDSADTPWGWVQNLSKKDIDSAVFFCNQQESDNDADDAEAEDKESEDAEEQKIELSEKDIDKLFIILYRLSESDFSENTKSTDSTRDYGLMINMTDGNVYYILPSVDQRGALEMKFGDKTWFIDSDELNEFMQSFLNDAPDTDADDEDDKDDDEYSSEADLEPTDVSSYASDGSLIVQEEVDYSTYSNITFGDNPETP